MLTFTAKLLFVPALVALATIGLLTFLLCRELIGMCTAAGPEEEDAPA